VRGKLNVVLFKAEKHFSSCLYTKKSIGQSNVMVFMRLLLCKPSYFPSNTVSIFLLIILPDKRE